MLAWGLAAKCPTAVLLHDRRMPSSRANIDHIAITATGVYVIDAELYRGKIELRSPLFGRPKLVIDGRNRTQLVDGLEKQVAVVRAAVAGLVPVVPVQGCFCFVAPEGLFADVGLPATRTLTINGFPLYHSRRLAKQLSRPGAMTAAAVAEVRDQLAESLPPA